jgi:NADH-ubiquinone oxidoreductase-F iron-sulfur binding region
LIGQRPPGSEARAGRFPGPSLIPDLHEIQREHGWLPGGASSNFLGPEQLDLPLDFGPLAEAGSMLGSGALVAIAEGTDLLAAATNVLRFFRNESGGKCVPCRVGSTKANAILSDLIESGRGAEDVDERILELEKTMRLTSTCGLGQVALGPAISVLGLKRGATETRPQPRPPRPPDRTTPGDAGPEASAGGANAASDGAAASDSDSS